MSEDDRQQLLAKARRQLDKFRSSKGATNGLASSAADVSENPESLTLNREATRSLRQDEHSLRMEDLSASTGDAWLPRNPKIELNGYDALGDSGSGYSTVERLRQLSQQMSDISQTVPDRVDIHLPASTTINNEVIALEDRLKMHAKTIDLLMAEKSELKGQVQRLDATLRSKNSECESLTDSVRAANRTASDITRNNNELQVEVRELNRMNAQLANENRSLRRQVQNAGSRIDELEAQRQQLTNKVADQTTELTRLNDRIVQLQNQVQLQSTVTSLYSPSVDTASRFKQEQEHQIELQEALKRADSAVAEKRQFETELLQLRHSLEQLQGERRELDSQWRSEREKYRLVCEERDSALLALKSAQAVSERLQNEMHSAQTGRLQAVQQALATAEERIVELTAALNNKKDESKSAPVLPAANTSVSATATIKGSVEHLSMQLDEQIQANEQLLEELHTREATVQSLQREILLRGEAAADAKRLIEKARGDAETISRATMQNQELKKRLEELEDRFVQITNDKLALTSDLQSALHKVAALSNQSSVTTSADVTKAGLGNEDTVAALRLALENSTIENDRLTAERSQLLARVRVLELAIQETRRGPSPPPLPPASAGLIVDAPPAATTDPVKRDDTTEAASVREENRMLLQRLREMQLRLHDSDQAREDMAARVRKEELLNAQLAGEADTIGEYIALYHQERRALRERFREKDVYIDELLESRSHLEKQIAELKRVIRALLKQQQLQVLPQAQPPASPFPSSAARPLEVLPVAHENGTVTTVATTKHDDVLSLTHIEELLNTEVEGSRIVVEHCACATCTGPILRV